MLGKVRFPASGLTYQDPPQTLNRVRGDQFLICSFIQSELSNMSFEEILKLQSKVGTRVFKEVAYGTEQPKRSQKKRLNRNR